MFTRQFIVLFAVFHLSLTYSYYRNIWINRCTLPNQIENGKWSVLSDEDALPGDEISSYTEILITCNEGYKVYPSARLTCDELHTQKPQCIKTCPSLEVKFGTTITCKFQRNDTQCNNPYQGTTAFFKCAKYYENRNNDRKVFTCQYGKWNFSPKYDCQPVCGKKFVRAEELIIHGDDAELNEFTWHIAIYENKGFFNQICGGVIITPKISLSAAHCFIKPNNSELYFVGAGKLFRNYLDPRDVAAQYRNVSNIIIPKYFSADAESRYDYDIAVIVLQIPFKMTAFVLPACLDKSKLLENDALLSLTGTVTGWGFTEKFGSPSDRLKKLDVNYKNQESCILSTDFKKYYFPHVRDKICAGIYQQGKSACKGDSGGALVFLGDDERYYVKGLVSIGPKRRGNCDANQYTLYTSIAFHIDFIQEQIDQYNELSNDGTIDKVTSYRNGCILPKIENGKWELKPESFHSDYTIKSGYPIRQGTELIVMCNNGFKTFPEHVINITCNNQWSTNVECRRFCPTLIGSGVNITCDDNGAKVSCDNPYHHTVASVSCLPMYKQVEFNNNPYLYCEDGFWSDDLPQCKPTCGLNFLDGQKIISDLPQTSIEEFPWHVGIYNRNSYEYICSGILFSTLSSVMTTNCVEGFPANELLVVAGKTNAEYHIYIDRGKRVQRSYVYKINRFSSPDGMVSLELSNELILDKNVQPLCEYNLDDVVNKEGFLASWQYSKPRNVTTYLVKIKIIARDNAVCGLENDDNTKFCAEVIGNPACQGISGAAVVFQNYINGPYHIIGLDNIKTSKGQECNKKYLIFQRLRGFTNIPQADVEIQRLPFSH